MPLAHTMGIQGSVVRFIVLFGAGRIVVLALLRNRHAFVRMPGETGGCIAVRPENVSVANEAQGTFPEGMETQPIRGGVQAGSDGVAWHAGQVPMNCLGGGKAPIAVLYFDGLTTKQGDNGAGFAGRFDEIGK